MTLTTFRINTYKKHGGGGGLIVNLGGGLYPAALLEVHAALLHKENAAAEAAAFG